MNTFTKNNILGIALATLVFVALSVGFASTVKAADMLFPDFIDYSSGPDVGGGGFIYPDFVDYSSAPSYGGGYLYPDYVDYYSPSYGGYGYSTPSYYTPSYGGGYGYFMPSYGYGQSQSLSNTNVNQNTCTNGSCNQNTSINAPTTVVTNNTAPSYSYPYPVYTPTYTTPVYDICPNVNGTQSTLPYGYYIQNGYCYVTTYTPPTTYTPYVSLSQVPYTGLEMGPVGTALYWTFLVFWCFVAAYLLVVKRVHNTVIAKVASMIYGKKQAVAHSVHNVHTTHAKQAVAKKENTDEIDPFIRSQIFRA